MNERYLSPKARRRREIVADVELIIAYASGVLTSVISWLLLHALGVL